MAIHEPIKIVPINKVITPPKERIPNPMVNKIKEINRINSVLKR